MRNAIDTPQLQQPSRTAADPARTSGIGSPTHWTHEIITRDVIARDFHQDGWIDDASDALLDPQPGSGHVLETII